MTPAPKPQPVVVPVSKTATNVAGRVSPEVFALLAKLAK